MNVKSIIITIVNSNQLLKLKTFDCSSALISTLFSEHYIPKIYKSDKIDRCTHPLNCAKCVAKNTVLQSLFCVKINELIQPYLILSVCLILYIKEKWFF